MASPPRTEPAQSNTTSQFHLFRRARGATRGPLLSRSYREAEVLAARAQGFADAEAYSQWLADDVVTRKLP